MTDAQRAELKRLAEAAPENPNIEVKVSGGLVDAVAAVGAYIRAANPAAVLDLLKELGKAEADNACALEHIRSHIARHEGTPTAARMEAFLAFEHPGANLFSELDALKTENERLKHEVRRLRGELQGEHD